MPINPALTENNCDFSGNFVLSPLAVSAGLAALYRGAHEQTAQQLKHALKLDLIHLEDPDVHGAYRELLQVRIVSAQDVWVPNYAQAESSFLWSRNTLIFV